MSNNYLPLCYEEEFEDLNFNPSCLEIPRYALPDTFGDAGAEDFMARLISFSIGAGELVGVGFRHFSGQMTEIFLSLIYQKNAKQRNEKMKYDYKLRTDNRWLSLSLYGYKVPKEPNYIDESSFITTVLYSRDDFKNAFHYLIDHGYLSVAQREDDVYLCPTADAVRKLKKFYTPARIRIYSRLQILEMDKCGKRKEILQLIEENSSKS